MADAKIVCWSCHALVGADEAECPSCKAGLALSGRRMTEEVFHAEQLSLRRTLGISNPNPTVKDLEIELAGLPVDARLGYLSAKEQARVKSLRQSLESRLESANPEQDPPTTGEGVKRFRTALKCPQCGATSSDPDGVFCQKCGGRIVDEEMEAIVRSVLDAVESTVPPLVSHELANYKPPATSTTWEQTPEDEKWKIAWGVWWRILAAQIGLFAALYFILAAVAANQ